MVQQRCKQCGSELNAKVKNCPSCGHLVRKNIFARAVLFIIAVLLVFYIYPKLTNKLDQKTQQKHSDPFVSTTASILYKIYEENTSSADKQFKGKIVSVTGEIGNIGKDMIGKFHICLKTENNLCGIQCFFDKTHKKKVIAQEIKILDKWKPKEQVPNNSPTEEGQPECQVGR